MYYKKTLIVLTVILGVLITSAQANNHIEIKGFKLDMTKKEAKANWKDIRIKSKWLQNVLIPNYYMTLAGIDVPKPYLSYDKKNKAEGKPVYYIAWEFCYKSNMDVGCSQQGDRHSPTSFALIVEALKTKYPLECYNTTLQNSFGATFEDRTCTYTHNGITIKTQRYDPNGGVISSQRGTMRIYRDNGQTKYKTDDL